MQASEVPRAVAAAMSTASSLDLTVEDAIVLHDSNKLTLRLLPCDVLARVAPVAHQVAQFEVELAQRLAESGCPVAALEPRVEPRVYERDGFVVTLWTYYEPVTVARGLTSRLRQRARAAACRHAHARCPDAALHGSSRLGSTARGEPRPHSGARRRGPGAARRHATQPETSDRRARRASSCCTASRTRATCSATKNGLLFIDLETCCRGPVEFDLAHAPEEVSEHYPGVDQDLLRDCRILVLAMITTWRWDGADQLPNGRQLGTEWLSQIRAAREAMSPSGPPDELPDDERGSSRNDIMSLIGQLGWKSKRCFESGLPQIR